jgi:hypothetical protein
MLRMVSGLVYSLGYFMRQSTALLAAALFAALKTSPAFGQTCTGLACQQQTCSGNQTTTVSGVVYAPNGTDPLPNVTVYVPNSSVDAFTAGVSCPVVGAPPSGSPLVGTTSNTDGTFVIGNMPVGANIPLVIVSGRWRRQLVIPSVPGCTNTALPPDFAVMPKNQTLGDIPKIAIATGSVDQVECVLRKVGLDDAEFTDASGTGRINLFTGTGIAAGAGARVDSGTPSADALMGSTSVLNSYDVLMLPCEGGQSTRSAQQLANLVNFANSGGRVYASHYSYDWMYRNPPFDTVVNWAANAGQYPDGTATVDTSFTAGQTLSQWLQLVGASTTAGQMAINTLRHDLNGVNPPTQSWLTLNTTGNPVMQFVFDTPIGAQNQCGRVLFNEYHVENGSSSPSQTFPSECRTGAMTPQEKLLEYMLFELTADGGQPALLPTSKDFGSFAVGFTSPPQVFTWTNNSSFPAQVGAAFVNGDFSIASNNCTSVQAGASCQIAVTFTPTALGARSGVLIVQSAGGNSITAALSGTGTPGFSLSGNSLAYGDQDVGYASSKTLTLTSLATGPLPVPPFVTTGAYTVDTSACGTTVPAGASCAVKITFKPTTTGAQPGTLSVNSTSLLYSGLTATMAGNGVDFTIVLNPTSGKVIAGDAVSTTASIAPIAGFSFPLTINCNLGGAVAANCGLSTSGSIVPQSPSTTVTVNFSTTSQFTVVGYGVGGHGWVWLIGIGSGLLLLVSRRRAGSLARTGLFAVMLLALGISGTGCSGKLPTQNSSYTGPGSYTITVTATDGFLVHSATYNLAVTAK